MRKFFVLTLALALGGGSVVYADSIPTATDAQNQAQSTWTMTVYNDAGETIQSGEIVVWDRADSDVYDGDKPYVILPTAADDVYTAGVMKNTCLAGQQCEIIVRGIAKVRCLDLNDAVGIGTTVGASATDPGLCGDYTPAANKTSVGVALEGGNTTDYEYITVYVNPTTAEQ